MNEPAINPYEAPVAGVAYCLLFVFLNLCVVKMRRVHGIGPDLPPHHEFRIETVK
jgi:hypothetical protein